ncbi:MAG: DUF3090 domain-containing protein [Chloroflexota bacterium]|nr:DUF3090 domain-containing protein [Chloroflexota bacterium]
MTFEAQHVFGPATRLQAQAIGEPGRRTFRLLVESDDGRAAALWVEKEQLQALGLAIEQVLADFKSRGLARASRQPPIETFPANPTVDFKVGRLALGQDESELESGPRYVLLVYDIEGSGTEEEEPSQPATFATRATRDQLRALSRNIAEVVAAGRPRCPLCGEPIDKANAPHGCIRGNGHKT